MSDIFETQIDSLYKRVLLLNEQVPDGVQSVLELQDNLVLVNNQKFFKFGRGYAKELQFSSLSDDLKAYILPILEEVSHEQS